MKVLLLNGSPRKGNTEAILSAVEEGIKENTSYEVENLNVSNYKVAGCMACDCCKTNGGNCVIKDDGKYLVDKLEEADIVIFGSPVYWWGISTQLKAVIDRMYMKDFYENKKHKKIGLITVGAADLDDEEYDIISRQFRCICEYLDWELVINESISAMGVYDLKSNPERLLPFKELWKELK